VNRQIVKLFAFVVVLFGVLVGFTSYWSVFDAKALKEKEANKRPLLEQQQIRRGRILAADGTVLARSVPKGHGANLRFVRRYPEGSLVGHPIGYSFVRQGDSEFEQSHNEELVGSESEFGSILDQLTGRNQEGDDVVTNIDMAAQRTAMADLRAVGFGAVVAIEPRSGRVLVLASNPSYDPNRVPFELTKLNESEVQTPLVDRATQGQYPPGSTFKVVTAAAGLESGTITPETTIDAPGTLIDEGHELSNDFNQSFGPITLDTALTNSVNTWFAQLGQRVGQDALFEQMEKFGFNAIPGIDLPPEEVSKSGVYSEGKLLGKNDPVDLARVAIGQERLAVTPLQVAEVAAAVADGVKRMEPSEYGRAVSAKTAAELTTAMEGVVREGTGTNAAISGVQVAGKTGTAETPGNVACGGGSEENQGWFMGFAPANEPKIAIAATIECTTQFGNDVAAPIFRDVAETILNGE
jgi:penicillin-binding protein A